MRTASSVLVLAAASAIVSLGCDAPKSGITMDSRVLVDARGVATPLVCPGARGCAHAGGALKAGAAKRAITPDVAAAPVYLAGFGMGRQATGVHDDVWSRMIVVEQGDVRVGLVVLDCVGFFHQDVERVREAAKAAGLDLDDVIVTSTHVHESKDTMGMWGADVSKSGYDDAYQQFIVDQTVSGLSEAVAALQPAALTVGAVDDSDYLRDSRLPLVIDPTVHTLQFDAVDGGAPIATLVVWGNHPESLGSDNTLLTSDYPNYVRDEVETELPGTVAVFASGVLGGLTTPIGTLVCPDADGNETCPQGTFERAEAIGRHVGQLAVASLHPQSAQDGAARVEKDPALAVRRLPVMLTPTSVPLALAFQVGLISRPAFDTDSGEPLSPEHLKALSVEDLKLGSVQIDSEVSALSLGGVEMVTVPGELYAELWLAGPDGAPLIEHPEGADFPDAPLEKPVSTTMRDAPTKIILNQANDAVGYIIPWAQFDQEAPYAYDPEGQYGEQNSIGANAAPEVTGAVQDLYALDVY